ncbi:uncharacterized protein LOC123408020 isoform X2 [Hordeum vulgare subsp. vulgare]|uniref:uncharacterized protein LOC123408020 isoform X2 n=1 Tax=Hordeum vulgare subsp. vulgare TaxID=112509 RepID=UPI001D1A4000|nr:uncharacterized protein LOC123408020 isoform X2 [Hordeum vulgare subsp. vulgare]
MRRCEAIKQQHNQLRRGDGAEQGTSDKVTNAKRGEKDWHRSSGGTQPAGSGRGRHRQPSLESISETAAGESSNNNVVSESTVICFLEIGRR